MAPRGIVAAAVTSLFAIELTNHGVQNSELLVPLMFLIIVATITIYGLGAFPLSKILDITDANPQGCLIVGAHSLGRSIAKALDDEGFKTLLVDTNRSNIFEAKMNGLKAVYGNILTESIIDELNSEGIGKLLAITPNNEVNSLATLQFAGIFGSANIFQIGIDRDKDGKIDEVSKELRGKILFSENSMLCTLEKLIIDDSSISSTQITKEFDFEIMKKKYGEQNIIPMFLITSKKELKVYSINNNLTPQPGDVLMNLILRTA
ncbi:trkA-N domain protein [bacterium BMS3Abin04]|nr:trkA-N domain protein [bacterium BMS3Abin04]